MKISEQIRQALRAQDSKLANAIAEKMHTGGYTFRGQPVIYTYDDMIDHVARSTGRDKADVGPEWEALLAAATEDM